MTNPFNKRIFFGTICLTVCVKDRKRGSPIVYNGIYKGRLKKTKAKLLALKQKNILFNYWNSLTITADIAENYSVKNMNYLQIKTKLFLQ